MYSRYARQDPCTFSTLSAVSTQLTQRTESILKLFYVL